MATSGYSDLGLYNDETFDFLCSICQINKKNSEAEKFCTQCDEYFCSSCVKIHEKLAGLKYHMILDKSQFKSGASVVVQELPTETCKQHGHKPVDMFCEQHDKIGCSNCMVIDHSECKKKFYIPDYIKNKPAGNTADISAHLDILKNSIQELQKALNDDDRKLRTSKDALIDQIKQLRKEMNQRLDDLEKHTMNRADTTFQSLLESVQSTMKKLQQIMADIKSTQDSLKGIAGNQAQLFVSMKQASYLVSTATEVVQTTPRASPSPTVSFSADQKLQSLLQEMEVLGSIYVTEGRHDQARSQDVSLQQKLSSAANQQQAETKQHVSKQAAEVNVSKLKTDQMPSLLKIKGKKKCPVKLSSDTNICYIISACVLDDGTVILADHDNKKLKRLDRSIYRVRDSCDVPWRPWQVCVISQQEVAVSCYVSKLIQLVSVGSTMCCTRQIHTDFWCQGLACADGKLYISDWDTSVYVYTVSGERLQQFSKDQSGQSLFSFIFHQFSKDQSGQSLFSYIHSLAVSSDNSRIYVADWNKGLIILDTSGKLVSQYKGPQLAGARGVCLYKNDSVLVCGCHSKNVLQFTADGQLVGEVLKTDEYGQILCWDNKNSKLIVPVGDNIEVYDINTEL